MQIDTLRERERENQRDKKYRERDIEIERDKERDASVPGKVRGPREHHQRYRRVVMDEHLPKILERLPIRFRILVYVGLIKKFKTI